MRAGYLRHAGAGKALGYVATRQGAVVDGSSDAGVSFYHSRAEAAAVI
jgi:hypothetical protein